MPPPSARPSRAGLVIGVVVAATVLLGVGVAVGIAASGHVSPAPAAVSGKPRVVYSDNFQDPRSGWRTASLAAGATYSYNSEGYVIEGHGDYHWFATAPYRQPIQQLTISVTATQVTNGQLSAGFGASCLRGIGTSTIRYEILVEASSRWLIERRDGDLTKAGAPAVIAEGTAPIFPGARSMTISGSCLTQADGHTTVLSVWIDGSKVGSVQDDASLAGTGWIGQIVASTEGTSPCPLTVTHFEERTGPLSG